MYRFSLFLAEFFGCEFKSDFRQKEVIVLPGSSLQRVDSLRNSCPGIVQNLIRTKKAQFEALVHCRDPHNGKVASRVTVPNPRIRIAKEVVFMGKRVLFWPVHIGSGLHPFVLCTLRCRPVRRLVSPRTIPPAPLGIGLIWPLGSRTISVSGGGGITKPFLF